MSTLRKGMGAPLLLALTLACFLAVPELHAQYETKLVKNWINWNGMFKEKVDSVKQRVVLNKMKSQISALSPNSVDGVKSEKGKLTKYLHCEGTSSKWK